MDETEIKNLHPLVTGRHDLFAVALDLVTERPGKFELVELVNALLMKIELSDNKAREECAAICDARAMKCENEITTELSQDEIVELRSLAWQFSVLAQQIRNTIEEGVKDGRTAEVQPAQRCAEAQQRAR